MAEQWYSCAALARELGIPGPTAQRYLDLFEPFFEFKGERGERRQWRPSALPRLREIRQLYEDGHSTKRIARILRGEAEPIDVPTEASRDLVVPAQALEALGTQLAQVLVGEQSRQLEQLRVAQQQQIDGLRRVQSEEIARLVAVVGELKAAIQERPLALPEPPPSLPPSDGPWWKRWWSGRYVML